MEKEALIAYLESEVFLKASSNSTRLVAKLKSAVQRQELYETHQIVRTIYFRFINSKDKVNALENLLYQGACYLLDLKEFVSGQDIATLFLETAAKCLQCHRDEGGDEAKRNLVNPSLSYHSNYKTRDWDLGQKVSNIAIKLPDSEIGQSKFIAEVLRVLSPKLLNRNLLHEVMANRFWQQKDFVNSRYHYLHCANLENAQDIARLLVEYQSGSAVKSEVDLFITQFIFQLLCLQCPLDTPKSQANQKTTIVTPPNLTVSRKSRSTIKSIAEKIFSTYTLNHPQMVQICIPFSSLPLLNFTYFIISILDSEQDAGAFRMLRDIYQVTWTRDPNYKNYLSRIGTLYFGIVDEAKQQRQGGGFLNNILLSLLEGTDEDEEDSNQEGNNFSSSDELD